MASPNSKSRMTPSVSMIVRNPGQADVVVEEVALTPEQLELLRDYCISMLKEKDE